MTTFKGFSVALIVQLNFDLPNCRSDVGDLPNDLFNYWINQG